MRAPNSPISATSTGATNWALLYKGFVGLTLVILVLTEILGSLSDRYDLNGIGSFLLVAIVPWLLIKGNRVGRTFVAASILAAIWVIATEDYAWQILSKSLERAAFFQAFLIAVFSLQEAANRSESMKKVGNFMVTQPIRKQSLLTLFGTNAMALMMNMGSLVMIGILVRDREADQSVGKPISERGWTTALAAIRGFSPSALWSPLSLPPVYLASLFPSVSLKQTMAVGIAMSIGILLFSGLFTILEAKKSKISQHENITPAPFPRRSFIRLSILIIVVFSHIFFLSEWMSVSTSFAVMVVIPVTSIFWLIALQGFRFRGLVSGPLRNMVIARLPLQAAETSIIISAAFLGPILVTLLPVNELNDAVSVLTLHPALILCVIFLATIALAMIGLNPIITGTIIAGIISQPLDVGIEPISLVAVLLICWALSAQFSPYSGTAMLVGSIFGVSPVILVFRRNRAFIIWCVILILFFICVSQALL